MIELRTSGLSLSDQRRLLFPLSVRTDEICHLSLLFTISMIVFPLKRRGLVTLLFLIPALIEIVQFFVPGRVPDLMDAVPGYIESF